MSLIFEARCVLSLHQDGEIEPAYRPVTQERTLPVHTINEATERPLIVEGLRRDMGDFALLALLVQHDSGAIIRPYLITEYCNDTQAVIADQDYVAHNPLMRMKPYLAASLCEIKYKQPQAIDAQFEEFELLPLATYAAEHYPLL